MPGPRYLDHLTMTGGRGVVRGALVPLVYFMSSVAQSVNIIGDEVDAVRPGAAPTCAIGP